jgi:hypothetical protein
MTWQKKKRGDTLARFRVKDALEWEDGEKCISASTCFEMRISPSTNWSFPTAKKLLDRFIRETQLMAMLNDPHVALFHDAFCDNESSQ